MPDVKGYFDFVQLKNCKVVDSEIVDGMIQVELKSWNKQEGVGVQEDRRIRLLKLPGQRLTPPKNGTFGHVIFTSTEPNAVGYWIGESKDRFGIAPKNAREGVYILESDDGKNKISYTDGSVSLESNGNKTLIDKTTISFKQDESEISLDNEGFKLNIQKDKIVYGRFHLKNNIKIDTVGDMRVTTGNSIQYQISKGSFIISGTLLENPSNSGSLTDKYKPIESFAVKSSKMEFRGTNGPINFSGAMMNIKLGSNKVGGGSDAPDEAFALEAVEGDMNIIGGSGDMLIQASNLHFTDSLILRNGRDISPTKSYLELNSTDLELKAQSLPGSVYGSLEINGKKGETTLIGSKSVYIQTDQSNIELSSQMTTKIDAMKNIELHSTMNTEISADLKAFIESKIETKIKSDIKVIIESAILDLEKTNMIKAGQKTVAPTGVGPFCALSTCLFTGAAHTGNSAVG